MLMIDFFINRGLLSQIRHLLVDESLFFNRSSVNLKKLFSGCQPSKTCFHSISDYFETRALQYY